jgi:hypothetical protein
MTTAPQPEQAVPPRTRLAVIDAARATALRARPGHLTAGRAH